MHGVGSKKYATRTCSKKGAVPQPGQYPGLRRPDESVQVDDALQAIHELDREPVFRQRNDGPNAPRHEDRAGGTIGSVRFSSWIFRHRMKPASKTTFVSRPRHGPARGSRCSDLIKSIQYRLQILPQQFDFGPCQHPGCFRGSEPPTG
jgi:hypothetical protein